MAPVEYVIPLLPLDRLVLGQVEAILPSFEVPQLDLASLTLTDPSEVFRLWAWTTRVTEYLHLELDGEGLEEHGDRNRAYLDVLNSLKHGHGRELAAATFRVDALEEANRSFLPELGDRPADDIQCVPAHGDEHFWSLMQSIYSHGKLRLRKASRFQPTYTFDVWESMQMLLIQSKILENASGLYQNIFKHPSFTSLYEFRPKATPQEEDGSERVPDIPETDRERIDKGKAIDVRAPEEAWQILRRQTQKQIERWPDDKLKYDTSGKITREFLEYLLRNIGTQEVLEDPCNYLHLVPWSQLVSISWQRVEGAVEIDDPFDDIRHNARAFGYMLWKPPNAAFKWLHHIRTEEEVLQYCIAHNWTLPSYSYGETAESVLFALKPVEKTPFFEQLGKFWDLWNDCAATVRPSDQQIFLLETIPGLQFRSRIEQQDIQAALKYFRNVIEAHHAGALHQRTVVDFLGPDNAQPYYDKSLQIIPHTQLSEVSSNPIGQGANGAVYAARWQRPTGALATTNSRASQVSVVLKEILPVSRGVNTLQKLLKELNLTYLALAGNKVGCVDFMGVTTLPVLMRDPTPARGGRNTDQRLLLVFERATEGSLLEYLDRVFPDLSFMQAWDKVIGVISNVANGLHSLHRRKIIHRDLHPNNVLVARTYYVNDSEDQAVVTDIGEGKSLDTRDIETSAGASYGCREFRAPEVQGTQGWSSATDVFSFGVLCCKVLDVRTAVCTAQIPIPLQEMASASLNGEEIVPQEIKKTVQSCLRRAPTERPGIRSVIRDLDNLSGKFYYEEEGYTAQKALREEPEELLKQIEWSTLNWRHELAVARGAVSPDVSGGEYTTRDSILDD